MWFAVTVCNHLNLLLYHNMSEILQSLKSNADAIVGSGGLFVGLTSVIVVLRILSRPLLKIKFGIEDFFLVAGLLLFLIETALVFEGRLTTYIAFDHCVSGITLLIAVHKGKKAASALDFPFEEFLKVCSVCT